MGDEPPAEAAPAAEGAPAEAPAAEAPPGEAPPSEVPTTTEGAPSEAVTGETVTSEVATSESEGAEVTEGETEPHMVARAATLSRVRMQEPGEADTRVEEEHQRGADDQRSSISRKDSVRKSVDSYKEGIMRRKSDRPSKSKLAVGSTVSIRRGSAGYTETTGGGKAARYMNSYKLDSDKPFKVEVVETILKDVLTEALDNLVYDPDKCPKQAKWASSAIRARIKEKEFDRYKIVIIVTIGQKRYHDMCCVFRFLWDLDRDKFAMCTHDNLSVFASALCFGLYYE